MSVPSVVVVATIGMGLAAEASASEIRNAMYAAPAAGLFINIYLLVAWVWLPTRLPARWTPNLQLAAIVTTAVLVWGGLTLPWELVVYPRLREATSNNL